MALPGYLAHGESETVAEAPNLASSSYTEANFTISSGGITCQDQDDEPGYRKGSSPALRGFARSMSCSSAERANNQKRYAKCRACFF
jgi:hypothetical protein